MAGYNINVSELDENSPIADHPKNVNITLKRHQLSLLHQCMQFEKSRIPIACNNNTITKQDVAESNAFVRTHVGILGDKVGSGKSYVLLSLINHGFNIPDEPLMRMYASNNILVCTNGVRSNVKTNVLVVPHNLVNQWMNYIREFSSNLKTLTIVKGRSMETLRNVDINDYDILMVSCTFYNRVVTYMTEKAYKVRRVIYDEADNMNIPSCAKIDAFFYWFVTASFGNLLYPRGFSNYDPVQRRYIMHAYGIRNSGFVKDMFVDLNSTEDATQVARILIAKNSDAYIAQSIDLPPQLNMFVKCRTPTAINILTGIVDKHIIDALNANDINSALEYISPQHKKSEENIINIMIDKYQKMLKNIELRIEYSQYMEYDTPDERTQELERLETKRADIKKKISSIEERIRENNTCHICLDDVNKKTIVPCCNNGYCFKCINLWLTHAKNCPLCKAVLTVNDIYVVDANAKCHDASEGEPPAAAVDHTHDIHETNDKIKNLENILKKQAGQNNKYLLFSSYDNTFNNVIMVLERNGIKYAHLKGNVNHISTTLQKYRDGDVQVLLVNTRNYGSGLNLENTTDVIMFHKFDSEIEKQVVGRAQRYGRTSPLRVWYLLYNNEFTDEMQAMQYA